MLPQRFEVPSGLTLVNRQRRCRLRLPLLRQLIDDVLRRRVPSRQYEVSVFVVRADAMAEVNQTHLRHDGSTDVITFGYAEAQGDEPLYGDIFVCIDDALVQAQTFGLPWTDELVRYVVHGILHLLGYDDTAPELRRRMKRAENAEMRRLRRRFALSDLGTAGLNPPAPRVRPSSVRMPLRRRAEAQRKERSKALG
jgi:probable rRNA maturation factor